MKRNATKTTGEVESHVCKYLKTGVRRDNVRVRAQVRSLQGREVNGAMFVGHRGSPGTGEPRRGRAARGGAPCCRQLLPTD